MLFDSTCARHETLRVLERQPVAAARVFEILSSGVELYTLLGVEVSEEALLLFRVRVS